MTDQNAANPRGQLQLAIMALIFLGPLALAAWLYYGGESLQPEGRANHGVLLEPIVTLDDFAPGTTLAEATEGHRRHVYANTTGCGDDSREGLYTTRQIRLMLGRELDRVVRVFLHGDAPLDTLFIEAEHEGLVTFGETSLADYLRSRLPQGTPGNGYYLVDPLGNLVLYFPPGTTPRDMVSDIKRLLRLSRIG